MTTGNVLYLIMCVGMFSIFSAVLAYFSWQQAKAGPEMLAEPARQPEPHHALAA